MSLGAGVVRFLLAIHPATGHLQPVVPVLEELRRRGHEVLVATARSFCPTVRSLGLEAIPIGLDWSRASPEVAFTELADVGPGERYAWILRNVYAGRAARQTAAELSVALRTWRPDVVIRQQVEFGSQLAAESLDIPYASYGFGQGLLGDDRRVAAPRLAPLRAEWDLDPDPDLLSGYRFLRLEFAPPAYLAPDAPRTETTHHIRLRISECRPDGKPPDALPRLRGPAVVVTLGTNYNRTPGIFEAAIEGLADQPLEVVVTVGTNRDPAELGPLPSNVHVVRFVPLSRLLPRADLTVCHAGFNTVMTAVRSNTPLVLVPIDSDQPAQAGRCADLGLGRALDARTLTPGELRGAVRDVLRNRAYRRATEAFRAELESLPSTAHAADLLEALAADGRPVGPRAPAGEPAPVG